MDKVPDEVLAIKLPPGYQWDMLAGEPMALWVGDEHKANGWVNKVIVYDSEGKTSIRLPNTELITFPPKTSLVELCQALANHLWIGAY